MAGQSTNANPLVPLTGAQITNQIAGYNRALPQGMSEAEIRLRAQGMLDPAVRSIAGNLAASSRAASGAISGYTSELARNLAGYAGQEQQIYGGAQAAQAAADSAESGAIRGTGTDLAGGLSAKLAQMGGPSTLQSAVVAPFQAATAGAANATLGRGSAALGQLIAEGAAAQDFAGKQPGIARAQGLADINANTLAAQKNLADQTSAVEQKLPDIVQALRSQSDANRANIATGDERLREYYTARNDALQASGAKNETAVKVATIKAQTAAEAAKAKAAQTSFSDRLAFARTYGYDPVTNETLPGYTRAADGTVTKVSGSSSGSGAVKLANTTALRIIEKAAAARKVTALVPGVLGAPPTKQTKLVKQPVGSQGYYEAIHQAEAAIEPLLPSAWSSAQRTQFVQRLANQFFAPAKKGGR